MQTFLMVAVLATALTAHSKQLLLKNGEIDIGKSNYSFQKMNKADVRNQFTSNEYFVVQFKNVIQFHDQKSLKQNGITIVRYIPEDAYVVQANYGQILKFIATSKALYDVTPFQSVWKLSTEYTRLSIFDSEHDSLMNVRLFPHADVEKIKSNLMEIPHLEIVSLVGEELIVKARRANVVDLSLLEGVEWIQEQPRLETFDFSGFRNYPDAAEPVPLTGYESGTKIMNFDRVWAQGFRGENQIAAMADTGLDTGNQKDLHSDLETVLQGIPLGLFSNSWADPQGHGTHVAGSIIGTGRMSNGQLKGGAHGAGFIAVSIWSDLVGNISIPPQFATIFEKPYNLGARVHSDSWGSAANLGAYDNFAAQVDTFMWSHPDMLLIFAAGNSGQDLNKDGRIDDTSVGSPGTAKNTLTVGASENYVLEGGRQVTHVEMTDGEKKWGAEPIRSDKLSNNENGVAAFSSRGPTKDGRIKPDVVAPGTNIISLHSRDPRATLLWGAYDENYVYAGGTSMATPLTAGAATVTRQILIEKLHQQNPSAALIKATLMNTAFDMYPGQYGTGPTQELRTPAPNNQQGYGRVDMAGVADLEPLVLDDNKQGIGVGESRTYSFTARGTIRVNLVYTDYPASTSAQKSLVNDLDLEVVDPSGSVHVLGDRTNNAEMVTLKAARSGTYEIRVKGINVPQGLNGKQPFALIASSAKAAE